MYMHCLIIIHTYINIYMLRAHTNVYFFYGFNYTLFFSSFFFWTLCVAVVFLVLSTLSSLCIFYKYIVYVYVYKINFCISFHIGACININRKDIGKVIFCFLFLFFV